MRLRFGFVFCIQHIETVSCVCSLLNVITIANIDILGLSCIVLPRIYGQTLKCIYLIQSLQESYKYCMYMYLKTTIQQEWIETYRHDRFPLHLHFPYGPVSCQELNKNWEATNGKSCTCKLVDFWKHSGDN